MMITMPFSEQQSEHWLLERTYHARLLNGGELSVPDLSRAMKQITNFSVPLSTWQEISREEAHAAYQDGTPILLYGKTMWEHPKGADPGWSPNSNMHAIIFGDAFLQQEAVSGTDSAVRYLDASRGNFSNATWRTWFASDSATIFDGSDLSSITFLRPCFQFPYTTHYTVMAADGHVQEYADRVGAIQGFQAFPREEVGEESDRHTVSPQFSYYHEVTCPGGIYHLEFFGPRMDEPGYRVKETEERGKGSGVSRAGPIPAVGVAPETVSVSREMRLPFSL